MLKQNTLEYVHILQKTEYTYDTYDTRILFSKTCIL